MPRAVDPGSIIPGSGKSTAGQTDDRVLIGAGMGGLPPNIGFPGHIPPGGVLGDAEPGWPVPEADGITPGGSMGLHISDPRAHPAVAISVDGQPPFLYSRNVEGALDELIGAVAAPPPMLGQQFNYITGFSGIPDWGRFRMMDNATLYPYRQPPPGSTADQADVYPLYWPTPAPTEDAPFTTAGEDPATDPLWNGISGLPGSYPVAQSGVSGGFTNDSAEVVRTRVFKPFSAPPWGSATDVPAICVSGALFPADRGVLALIHWPDPDDGVGFLNQSLEQRCWAALLLGQGIGTTGSCGPCDGDAGGIFMNGVNADGEFDPFAYPGRATGQYDLEELHLGVSSIDSTDLPAPWTGGVPRVQNGTTPGAGQVRLGTDPSAGEADPTGYGIPILGATCNAYTPMLPLDLDLGAPLVGRAIAWGDSFFRYRLPYLQDYSPATGLKYTPSGADVYDSREKERYFQIASAASMDPLYVESVGGSDYLRNAGNYPGFEQDYWNWQIARYRQLFYIPDANAADVKLGSLMLIHFKKEADFERCVRDGVMPWDGTNGYEVYGASAIQDPLSDAPAYGNLVNEDTGVTATDFPAPTYGYSGPAYHNTRSNLYFGDNTFPPTLAGGSEWSFTDGGSGFDMIYVSGVAYYIPRTLANGDSFVIDGLFALLPNSWQDGYVVNDNPLTGTVSPDAPARLSSPNPALVSFSPFAYENPILSYPLTFTDELGTRYQRLEFPLEFCGSNGGGPFSEANGPLPGEGVVLNLGDVITLSGDTNYPAFSTDLCPRVFIRRPLQGMHPRGGAYGVGAPLPLDGAPTTKVLFHSTGFYETAPDVGDGGRYGNFLTSGTTAYDLLSNSTKDVSERFLDEVYRIRGHFPLPGIAPWVERGDRLQGPGLQHAPTPIAIPVQMGATAYIGADAASWTFCSWMESTSMDKDLSTVVGYLAELQVAGLPQRNPPPENWVKVPFPSSGMVIFPKTDYTVDYLPNEPDPTMGHQHDYSGCADTRKYTRAFDAAYSRDNVYRWNAEGQTTLVFRIDGLTLEDFQYVAPGPGSTGVTDVGIALQLKVPGQTTWMDIGRRDGDGPSKQDNALDGAGCLVMGPETFNGVDPDTGMVYAQVKVHVGPAATLARGYDNGGGVYEVPVLFRATMNPESKLYDLSQKNIGPGNFVGEQPYCWAHRVRALTGVTLLHPDHVVTPDATQIAAWNAYISPFTGPDGAPT